MLFQNVIYVLNGNVIYVLNENAKWAYENRDSRFHYDLHYRKP